MNRIIDNAIALRIVYLLANNIEDTDAYKLGIVDKSGKQLKKISELKTDTEKNSYNYLTKLVFKIRSMINGSRLSSLVAAYAMLKEEKYDPSENDILSGVINMTEEEFKLCEEIAATAVSSMAGIGVGEEPPIKKKPKMVRRNSFSAFVTRVK